METEEFKMRGSQALLAIAMLISGTAALAVDSALPQGWKMPMGAQGTAYEAARRIFPDASLDNTDHLILAQDKTLRLPGTSKRRAELPQGTVLVAPWFPLSVRSQGKRYTVLLWEGIRPENSQDGGFGNEVAVIAVFADGSIEPTDVAEVKLDHSTSLGGVISLGDEDAFTLSSTHSNSAQGYALTDLFHLRDARLRRITSSVFTLSNNYGCSKSFVEKLSWRSEPDGANLPRVIARVNLIHAPKEFTADCSDKPVPRTESFENSYRWDIGKNLYRDAGGNLDRLYKWNERNL